MRGCACMHVACLWLYVCVMSDLLQLPQSYNFRLLPHIEMSIVDLHRDHHQDPRGSNRRLEVR